MIDRSHWRSVIRVWLETATSPLRITRLAREALGADDGDLAPADYGVIHQALKANGWKRRQSGKRHGVCWIRETA